MAHEHGLAHLDAAAFRQPRHRGLGPREGFQHAHDAGGHELFQAATHSVGLADAVAQLARIARFQKLTNVQPIAPHALAEQQLRVLPHRQGGGEVGDVVALEEEVRGLPTRHGAQ